MHINMLTIMKSIIITTTNTADVAVKIMTMKSIIITTMTTNTVDAAVKIMTIKSIIITTMTMNTVDAVVKIMTMRSIIITITRNIITRKKMTQMMM